MEIGTIALVVSLIWFGIVIGLIISAAMLFRKQYLQDEIESRQLETLLQRSRSILNDMQEIQDDLRSKISKNQLDRG